MDERLLALLAALADEANRAEQMADLSDEQVAATREELLGVFRAIRAGEVEDIPADDVATLQSIHDAIGVLDAEAATRAEAAAEALAAIAAMEASIDGGGDPEAEVEDPEAPAAEADPEAPAAEVDPEPEAPAADPEPEPAVTAAASRPAPRRPRLAALAAQVPPEGQPAPGEMVARPRWQTEAGVSFSSLDELSEQFAVALNDIHGLKTPAGFEQKIPVVRFKTEMSGDHHIGQSDNEMEVDRKVSAITASARNPQEWDAETRALVASGGWCAPAEPRYDIPSIVTAARPFRDGLARMTSSRGTVNFVRAARLSTILANTTGAAVTTWENTTDEVPGGSTKTRQTMSCRTIQEEELGAVVARTRFGNFQTRAFPEDVRHDLELVQARHARVAETRLLDALIGDINIDVTQTGVAGTARDVKHHFIQAVSELRYTERTGSLVRCAFSDVLLDMIVADIAFQQASGELDALLADESAARRLLASIRGLAYITTLDVPTGADAFVTNSDNENLADFPDTLKVPFWYDGTAVFVDGGSLDLGIIRDSTLNGTNDYEMFMETFEGLLWLGPYAKTLTLTTCPNGISQIAKDVTGSLCSGS